MANDRSTRLDLGARFMEMAEKSSFVHPTQTYTLDS